MSSSSLKNLSFNEVFPYAGYFWSESMVEIFKTRFSRKIGLSSLMKPFVQSMLRTFFLGIVAIGCQLACVYFVFKSLILFLVDPTQAQWIGWMLCGLLFFTNVLYALFLNLFYDNNTRTAVKIRSCFVGMAFYKGLALRDVVSRRNDGGNSQAECTALVSFHATRLMEALHYFPWLFLSLVATSASFVLLYILFGWPCLPVLGLWAVFLVCQKQLGSQLGKVSRQIQHFTDLRIFGLKEFLSAVRVSKILCNEDSLKQDVSSSRTLETHFISKNWAVYSVVLTIAFVSGVVPSVLTFSVLVGMGNFLNPVDVFTGIQVFGVAFEAFGLMQIALSHLGKANEAVRALDSFLKLQEYEKGTMSRPTDSFLPAIEVNDASFSFPEGVSSSEFQVGRLNLQVRVGEWLFVTGPVGGGKSAFLHGLLDMMQLKEGSCTVRGSVAWVPQQPWLFKGSLRDNVLIGRPFDKKRFVNALHVAHLDADLQAFDKKDMTDVGDSGCNLSGGQKQRVSIARAAYGDSSIVLLDDCLSALDTRVSSVVFQRMQKFFANRAVVFISGKLFLASKCDKVLVLKHGAPLQYGTFDTLCNEEGGYISSHLPAERSDLQQDVGANAAAPSFSEKTFWDMIDENVEEYTSDSSDYSQKIDVTEEAFPKVEPARLLPWKMYLKGMGWWLLISFATMTIATCAATMTEFWITLRINGNIVLNGLTWVGIYVGLFACYVCTLLCSALLFGKAYKSSASKLHDSALSKLFGASMFYFDVTSIGNIVNVFSNELETLDLRVPPVFDQCVRGICVLIATAAVMGYVFPISLICIPPAILLSAVAFVKYRRASIVLQRASIVIKGQALARTFNVLSGISILRVFQKERFFAKWCEAVYFVESTLLYLFWGAQRWFMLRLQLISSLIVLFAALLAVGLNNQGSAFGALFLVSVFRVSLYLQATLRRFVDLESLLESVNHITSESSRMIQEQHSTMCQPPPNDWPLRGKVEFVDVSVNYREDTAPVISNMSFTLKEGWHMGVVGRTGAGKTTMMAAILRLVPYSGSIFIDGLDISLIHIKDLRKRIGMIPQSTWLFTGTLRYNIDPYEEHSDDEIWDVLKKVGLDSRLGEEGLDTPLSNETFALSVGQRQLLYVARVLLKKSNLCLIDEGTASVDKETEQVLKELLDDHFKNSTVITIAHKIEAVIHSDRIMVLDRGRIAEFDGPSELMSKSNYHFFKSYLIDGADSYHALRESGADSYDLGNCTVCFQQFGALRRKIICKSCSRSCCLLCSDGTMCFFCLVSKTDRDESTEFYLHSCTSLPSPTMLSGSCEICKKNEDFRWQCGVCSRESCVKCIAWMRPALSEAFQMPRPLVCQDCWSDLMERNLVQGMSLGVGQEELFVECFSVNAQFSLDAKLSIPLISGQCSRCYKKNISCTFCAICSSPICFGKQCTGYSYLLDPNQCALQEVEASRMVVAICCKCVTNAKVHRRRNGDLPAPLTMTASQATKIAKGDACNVCNKSFSPLLQPYDCHSCHLVCCRHCCTGPLEGNICRHCRERGGTSAASSDVMMMMTCKFCCEPIATDNVLWVNSNPFHGRCFIQNRKRFSSHLSQLCRHCNQVVFSHDKIVFNNQTLHVGCMPLFKEKRRMTGPQPE